MSLASQVSDKIRNTITSPGKKVLDTIRKLAETIRSQPPNRRPSAETMLPGLEGICIRLKK